MNAFLNPHTNTSLTGSIDATAHSISLFQENEQPKTINDIFIPKTYFSTAEPIDIRIDELGNNIVQVCQLIGIINDEKVHGLERMLNYMNDNLFSKDDPATNEHHYHITQHNITKKHTTHTT